MQNRMNLASPIRERHFRLMTSWRTQRHARTLREARGANNPQPTGAKQKTAPCHSRANHSAVRANATSGRVTLKLTRQVKKNERRPDNSCEKEKRAQADAGDKRKGETLDRTMYADTAGEKTEKSALRRNGCERNANIC